VCFRSSTFFCVYIWLEISRSATAPNTALSSHHTLSRLTPEVPGQFYFLSLISVLITNFSIAQAKKKSRQVCYQEDLNFTGTSLQYNFMSLLFWFHRFPWFITHKVILYKYHKCYPLVTFWFPSQEERCYIWYITNHQWCRVTTCKLYSSEYKNIMHLYVTSNKIYLYSTLPGSIMMGSVLLWCTWLCVCT